MVHCGVGLMQPNNKKKDPSFLATLPNPFPRQPKTAGEAAEDKNSEIWNCLLMLPRRNPVIKVLEKGLIPIVGLERSLLM